MDKSARQLALEALISVAKNGKSSSDVTGSFDTLEGQDRGLAMELLYGCLHHYYSLKATTRLLLERPLKSRDFDIQLTMMLGIYQLLHTRIPDHAVVHETVQLADGRNKAWAKNLLNAVLRRVQREGLPVNKLSAHDQANLPSWLYDQIQQDWQTQADKIITETHQRAPLMLRVNPLKTTRDDYQQLLQKAEFEFDLHDQLDSAIKLKRSMDVTSLPGYDQGLFSVQDAAAQCAANILDPQPGEKILDACAAPGGKSAHILELSNQDCQLVAIDNQANRLQRLEENLQRLGLQAEVRLGDAIETKDWLSSDDEQFNRILCDVPCSATGIIRRHPDIALHRTSKDVRKLNQIQWRILKSLWQLLKPGGIMVYSTCSILKSENETMVANFLKQQPEASLIPFTLGNGAIAKEGLWQIFPGEMDMDGFFYAKLKKAQA